MTLQLRHIELINAILRAGSLTQAAVLLHITQPAASKMLAHAELQLGFALFRRINGRLKPTPELETMAAGIEKLHEDLSAVRRLAKNLKQQPQGQIRVGCAPALGLGLLPRAIKACRDEKDGILFSIHTHHSRELVEGLHVRRLDLSVTFDVNEHPGIERIPIGHTELVHVAADEGETGSDEPMPIAALAQRNLIMLDVTDRAGALLETAMAREGVKLPNSDLQAQTHYVACALAHAGCGDTVVDALTARALQRPGLRQRPLSPRIPVPVSVMHHQAAPLREIDELFIEILRKTCKALTTLPPDSP